MTQEQCYTTINNLVRLFQIAAHTGRWNPGTLELYRCTRAKLFARYKDVYPWPQLPNEG